MGNGASIINAHEGPYSAKRVFTFQPGWGVQMPSQMEEVEGKMYMPLAPGALVGCGHSPTPIDLKFFKQLSFFCKTSKAGKFGLEMKNRADQQILNPWKIYIDIPDTRGSVQKVDCAITVANGVTDSNCTIVVFSDISDNFSIGVDLEFSNTLEENSPELWFAQKAIFKPSWGNNMKKPFKITEDGKEFYPIIPNTYIGSAHGEMGEVDLLDYPGIFLGVQTTQACKFVLEAKNKYDKHIIYMEVRLPNTNNQTEYIYVNLGNNIIDKKDDTRVSLFCLKDSTVKLYVDTEFLFAKASNDVAISSMMGGDNELWAVVGKKLVPASSFKFTAAWGDKLSQDGVEYVNGKEMVKLLGGSVVGCPHAEKSCDLRKWGKLLIGYQTVKPDVEITFNLELKNRADGQLFKGGNLPVTLPSFNGKVRYELIDIDDALVDFNEEGVDAGCTLIAFTNINTDFYLVNSLVFLSANNLYANKVLEPINSVQVWAGPNHNHISWGLSTDKVSNYVVYASDSKDGPFECISGKKSLTIRTFHETVMDSKNKERFYIVGALPKTEFLAPQGNAPANICVNGGIGVSIRYDIEDDEQLLDFIQRGYFEYARGYAHPETGLARESMIPEPAKRPAEHGKELLASGGTGFCMASLLVGVKRGWMDRADCCHHITKIAKFMLTKGERFHGAFPHWWRSNGTAAEFCPKDDAADFVETSFVLQSLILCREFFNDANSLEESECRRLCNQLWEECECSFFTRADNKLRWHWSPRHEWALNMELVGYQETLICHFVAAGHPKFPIDRAEYDTCWLQSNVEQHKDLMKNQVDCLFWTHYSFIGLNPNYGDESCESYFDAVGKHWAQTNVDYCKGKPKPGYSEDLWGLTACFLPISKGGQCIPGSSVKHDFGAIAPTGALSSYPYLPEASKRCMRTLYNTYGEKMWGSGGFLDAVVVESEEENKYDVADLYVAINQGPVPPMIENARSGFLWDLFMNAPEMKIAAEKLGFKLKKINEVRI